MKVIIYPLSSFGLVGLFEVYYTFFVHYKFLLHQWLQRTNLGNIGQLHCPIFHLSRLNHRLLSFCAMGSASLPTLVRSLCPVPRTYASRYVCIAVPRKGCYVSSLGLLPDPRVLLSISLDSCRFSSD